MASLTGEREPTSPQQPRWTLWPQSFQRVISRLHFICPTSRPNRGPGRSQHTHGTCFTTLVTFYTREMPTPSDIGLLASIIYYKGAMARCGMDPVMALIAHTHWQECDRMSVHQECAWTRWLLSLADEFIHISIGGPTWNVNTCIMRLAINIGGSCCSLMQTNFMEVMGPRQWRSEGGGRGGAWPPGASLGGGAGPAYRGRILKRKLGLGK